MSDLNRGQRAVLDALRAAGTRGITTNEFLNTHGIGSRYSARIHELRKEHGYPIRRERLSGSAWRFTLELEPPLSSVAAVLADVEGARAALPEDEQRAYREAQQSVVDARRHAEAHEGQRVVGAQEEGRLFDVPSETSHYRSDEAA